MAETDWGDLSSLMTARGHVYVRARNEFLEQRPDLVESVATCGLRLHGGRLPVTVPGNDLRVRAEHALVHLLDALRLYGTDLPLGWAVRDLGDMTTRTAAIGCTPGSTPGVAGSGADDTARFLVRLAAPLVRRSLDATEDLPVGSRGGGPRTSAVETDAPVAGMLLGVAGGPLPDVEAVALREVFLAKVITGRAAEFGAGVMLGLAWEWLSVSGRGGHVRVTRGAADEMGFDGVRELADALEGVRQAAASTAREYTGHPS